MRLTTVQFVTSTIVDAIAELADGQAIAVQAFGLEMLADLESVT